MSSRRSGLSCVSFQNEIYVIGGFNGINRLSTCEKFNPESNAWTFIPEMYRMRSNFAAEIIDNTILVCGGFDAFSFISSVECFNVERMEW